MQTVLQVKLPMPGDDVGEQVAEESRVLIEQRGQVELNLSRDEGVESDLLGRQRGPVAVGQPVLGVRATVADSLEDHPWQCRQQPVPSLMRPIGRYPV